MPKHTLDKTNFTMQLGRKGSTLLHNLRNLFGGNNVNADDIVPTSELTEQYLATAFVVWRFAHEVTTSTSHGNAAIANGHFGYKTGDHQNHVRHLCEQAVRNRDIRGPFMQRIDSARADSLRWSSTAQPVHDFGSYSVFRKCAPCVGSGRVSCGGCSGGGRRTCSGCGGSGSHNQMVTRTRWNGRNNETYSENIRRSCSSCGGGGRVVCTSCGGSGKQTCRACSGHGFFTDISNVRSVATPWWHVPRHSGLAAEALVAALERRGAEAARELVPFDLAGTEYNESDNWVVRYTGTADVVELGLDVAKTPYAVAAVGLNVIPIKTPPIFDQLLRGELKDIAATLGNGTDGRSNIRRQAKRLFAVFRSVPVLDQAMRSVAKLGKESRSNPAPVVVRVAEGFISAESAETFGIVFLHTLDKVSPANSRAAWALVALLPTLAAFVSAAHNFLRFSPAHTWQALLPLCVGMGFAGAVMVVVSPVGWALSATVSSLLRLKVPAEYRQRGRNWAPLKTACLVTMSASFTGALYGAAGAMHWVPPITSATTPIASYAVTHTAQEGGVNRFFAKFLASRQADAAPVVESPLDTRREVQRFLIAHGYLRGQADGTLGTRTNAAILKYERHEKLSVSTPMPELLAHMRTDTATSSGLVEPGGQLPQPTRWKPD